MLTDKIICSEYACHVISDEIIDQLVEVLRKVFGKFTVESFEGFSFVAFGESQIITILQT